MHDLTIWLLDLNSIDSLTTDQWKRTLSPLEQVRCDEMTHSTRQKSYIASHAMLYAQLKTQGMTHFSITHSGKPIFLSFDQTVSSIPSLSISHTKTHALCASHRGGISIGCDIEPFRFRNKILALSHHYFTPMETNQLQKLLDEQKNERAHHYFYQLWTAKESWLKAQGLGLANNLHRLHINNDGSYAYNDVEQQSPWSLFSTQNENYTLSIALNSLATHLTIQHVAWDKLLQKFQPIKTELMTPLTANHV